MKVIRVSNYDYEDHRGDQRQITREGLSQADAELICKALCDNPYRRSDDWFAVVDDSHELYRWEP